jgi:Sulfatase
MESGQRPHDCVSKLKAPYESLNNEYEYQTPRGWTFYYVVFIAIGLLFSVILTSNTKYFHETKGKYAINSKQSQYENSHVNKKSSLPNTIFILADDIGYNAIGLEDIRYSHGFEALSSLAKHVIIMNNYYTQELCAPLRASLLTGRYPISVGMEETGVYPTSSHGLGADQTTIAEVLTENGYNAYHFGKWDLGICSPDMLPTGQGFNYSLGYTQSDNFYWTKRNPDYPTYHDFIESNRDCYSPYMQNDSNTFSTVLYTDHLVDLISNYNSRKPFFCIHGLSKRTYTI